MPARHPFADGAVQDAVQDATHDRADGDTASRTGSAGNRAARRAAERGGRTGQPALPRAAAGHPRARQGRRVNPIRRTG